MKILIPAIVSTGVVTWFLNRRIQRLEVYREIAQDTVRKMINGVEELQPAEAAWYRNALELRPLLESGEVLNVEEVRRRTENFRRSYEDFKRLIELHRVYITPLIPYGGSNHIADCTHVVMLRVALLLRQQEEAREQPVTRDATAVQKTYQMLEVEHKKFQKTIDELLHNLVNGKALV